MWLSSSERPSSFLEACIRDRIHLIYCKRCASLYRPVSINILITICEFSTLIVSTVPAICINSLRLYDIAAKRFASRTLSVYFPPEVVYCFAGRDSLLCLSGSFERNSAYLLDLSTYALQALPPMTAGRSKPGLLAYEQTVYLFGSHKPCVRSCEKLSVRQRQWTQLHDMQCWRWAFSPVLYRKEIYLCDVTQRDRTVEAFSIDRESFRVISVSIPVVRAECSVAFRIGSEVHILAGDTQVSWRVGEATATTGQIVRESASAYSGCPPVVFEGLVYFSNVEKRRLVCFDGIRKTLSEVREFQ